MEAYVLVSFGNEVRSSEVSRRTRAFNIAQTLNLVFESSFLYCLDIVSHPVFKVYKYHENHVNICNIFSYLIRAVYNRY